MRKLLLIIVGLLVVLPVIEVVVLFQVAHLTGWWSVLGLLVAAGVAGLWVARRYGPSAWRQVRASKAPATRDDPEVLGMPSQVTSAAAERSTADRVLLTTAGLLLILPGLLSDVLALLLLVPAVRSRILDTLVPRLARRAQRAMLRSMGLDDDLSTVLLDGSGPGGFGAPPGAGSATGFGPGAGFPGGTPGRGAPSGPGAGPRPGDGDIIDI